MRTISILLFESVIDGLERSARDFPFPHYPFGLYSDWPVGRRRGLARIRDWPPRPEEVASFVPASEQLVLKAAQLSSPGLLGVFGDIESIRGTSQIPK